VENKQTYKVNQSFKWVRSSRPVIVDGTQYSSISEAAKVLKTTVCTLKKHARANGEFNGHKVELLPLVRTLKVKNHRDDSNTNN
jgi:hypothetical protein